MESSITTKVVFSSLFFLLSISNVWAQHDRVPGQFLMKYKKSNPTVSEKNYIQSALGVNVLKHNSLTNSDLVSADSSLNDKYAKDLLAQGIVEYIEPNYIVKTQAIPDDVNFSQLWGMNNTGQTGGTADVDIDAPQAWDLTTGSNSIVVGVVDTGINFSHPDLVDNMWVNPGEIPNNSIDDDNNGVVDDVHGFNAINRSGNPNDENGHGSHCSGTIAGRGNNGIGVAGVNWQVKLMGLKFLDASGYGAISDAITAIEYAVNMKNRGVNIKVLSNSWGGGGYSQALEAAITQADQAGIMFVAAAGNDNNDNDTNPSYPSSYESPNIVAVAAIDHNGNRASFSSYGETSVDIAAPGVNINSTWLGNGYNTISGTSMATPHVSGVAALVLSREPNLSIAALKDRLLNTRKPLEQLTYQMRAPGTVSAMRALTSQLSPLPPSQPEVTYTKSSEAFGYDSNLGDLLISADDAYKEVTLPFNFKYYGQSTNRLALSTNGRAVPLLSGQNIPVEADYSNIMRAGMLVYHDDLMPSPYSAGGIYYKFANNKAIFTWVAINYSTKDENNSQNELRFQLHISADGKIAYHYQDTLTAHTEIDYGAAASIGLVRITGTAGETVTVTHNSPNQNEVGNGKAVSFKVDSKDAYSDFDGDGKSDMVVFRPNTAEWFVLPSASKFTFSTYRSYQFGIKGDIPVVGDYDGDTIADLAVWRPKTGYWYMRLSSNDYQGYSAIKWGQNGDKPIVGDYDGDGKADLTVYRARYGKFYTLKSSLAYNSKVATVITLGNKNNAPIVGRFTNVGQDEFAIVNNSKVRFWSVKNINNKMLFSLPWGYSTDLYFAADMDGDKLTDRVVARKEGGRWKWYVAYIAGGAAVIDFGNATDIPNCSRDFDGDDKTDVATYSNATGMWNIRLSSTGKEVNHQFGLAGDKQP